MPSISSLLNPLHLAYPHLTFTVGEAFEWHPTESTIIYDPEDPLLESRLLHEVGHAQLRHSTYERDIDLIAMELDAWQVARMELAPTLGLEIPGEIIHHDMDTYRDWLHARSTCPHCGSNGIQVKKREYKCVTCRKTWHVNEARNCQLRRYRL